MTNHILSIAIDNYASITRLNNCVKDADNIVDILTSSYDFDKANVTRLYNKDATQNNIVSSLEDYLAKHNNSENLMILFSGHGDFDKQLDLGYFLPVESMLYNKSTYIPNTTIFNYIKAFEYRHVILLSDTCFSGSLFSQYRGITSGLDKLYEIPSKWALASGRVEIVSDGVPGTNSPFAASLIHSLKANTKPALSIGEISRQVTTDVGDKNDQLPRGGPLQQLGDKGGEFLFKMRVAAKTPKTVKLSADDSSVLGKIIMEYYEFAGQIEEAENNNQHATKRRLVQELELIGKSVMRELIKLLQLEKSKVYSSKKLQNILGKGIETVFIKFKDITEAKNLAVKNQKFEEAASFRDKEKVVEAEILTLLRNKKENIIKSIVATEDAIKVDFALLSLLTDITPVVFRPRIMEFIEKGFINILFLKYSKDAGRISKLRFENAFNEFTEQAIPLILTQILNSDKENEASLKALQKLDSTWLLSQLKKY